VRHGIADRPNDAGCVGKRHERHVCVEVQEIAIIQRGRMNVDDGGAGRKLGFGVIDDFDLGFGSVRYATVMKRVLSAFYIWILTGVVLIPILLI